jgi:hypothetical protein
MGTAYSCWLGQLLRAFSSFSASQDTAHGRSIYRALGTAEIQKTSGHAKRAWGWLRGVKSRQPNLFAHWSTKSPVGAIRAG